LLIALGSEEHGYEGSFAEYILASEILRGALQQGKNDGSETGKAEQA